MSDRTKNETIPSDELIFDADDVHPMAAVARHIRTCPDCKADLIQRHKSLAKLALEETEFDFGRPLTADEKKLFAKFVVVFGSIIGAWMVGKRLEADGGSHDALKKAMQEATENGAQVVVIQSGKFPGGGNLPEA